jgi:hypothetical protein
MWKGEQGIIKFKKKKNKKNYEGPSQRAYSLSYGCFDLKRLSKDRNLKKVCLTTSHD